MRPFRGIGYDPTDDRLDDRLTLEQSFCDRSDRRARMLNGKIVVREATLPVIGGTLSAFVFLPCVANVVVVMPIGAVMFVRRPIAPAVMARVVVMRFWPMMVCAERPMKRHVDCGQNLDAAEPNEACEQGCPTDARSGPYQASGRHALGSRRWRTSHQTPSLSRHLVFINRPARFASKQTKQNWIGNAAHSLRPGRRRPPRTLQSLVDVAVGPDSSALAPADGTCLRQQ